MIRKSQPYYIYGIHSVIAALKNPQRNILKILCSKKIFLLYEEIISKYQYNILHKSEFNKILPQNTNHQEIAVLTNPISSYKFDNIDLKSNIIIYDQINDINNVGSIIRSAAAFNIKNIILPLNNSPKENSAIAKIASGGLEFVKITLVNNVVNTIQKLKKLKFWIIGLDSNTNNFVTNLDKKIFLEKIVLILGSENKGLRLLTKKQCDFLIKIPIANIESLNVSASAAILFSQIYNK